MKYSIDEAGQKKGFLTLTWDGERWRRSSAPPGPCGTWGGLCGRFEDLLARGPCEDYVELVLEDEEPVLLAAERLRPLYPNLLSVSHPKAFAAAVGQRAAQLKSRTRPRCSPPF